MRVVRVFGALLLLCAARSVGAQAAKTAAKPDSTGPIVLEREVFQYDGSGRRDPFVSLLTTSELRPLFADLRLVAVVTDLSGQNSVAILRDVTSKEQYRVKVGQTLGRMRVNRIEPKAVVFTIEEFGFSRQETLVMGDSTQSRSQ
jgi:hypothetical protein